jgi:hypothetical protein
VHSQGVGENRVSGSGKITRERAVLQAVKLRRERGVESETV